VRQDSHYPVPFVKFCKNAVIWAGVRSGGGFLVFLEIVHVAIAVGLGPLPMGLGGRARVRRHQAAELGNLAHGIGSSPYLLVEAFEHVVLLRCLLCWGGRQ
jgi:hypothetical protein